MELPVASEAVLPSRTHPSVLKPHSVLHRSFCHKEKNTLPKGPPGRTTYPFWASQTGNSVLTYLAQSFGRSRCSGNVYWIEHTHKIQSRKQVAVFINNMQDNCKVSVTKPKKNPLVWERRGFLQFSTSEQVLTLTRVPALAIHQVGAG